ncbi:hypothetical protein HK096_002716 [Nowakowskiella sp. JEL0078]|nr:hypothetical protein HK096_002716 [Nowakowskiella sp. JEL0078]
MSGCARLSSRSCRRLLAVRRPFAHAALSLPANLRFSSSAAIPYSVDLYPSLKLQRSLLFKKLQNEDLLHFKSILPAPGSVISSEDPNDDELAPYNTDWMNKYRGKSTLVLRPQTTEQVSKILAYCSAQNIAVVPQGGNTGLVGGSVPVFDEVVISLGKMDSIRSFDNISGAVICEAGVVLEKLDNWLAERGFMCPLDLGAKGSCQIGGNVATNAGGLRLLRYGSLHGTVLGLEVVLPDGTIVNNLSTLRKDNTGYDIKQLFIGSEGTIGIITGVSILTPRRPTSTNVAVLSVPSYESVTKTFSRAKNQLNEILSAFEFWDESSADLVQKHLTHVRLPEFDIKPRFYVLVETQGSNGDHDTEKLSSFLEGILEDGIVEDGVLAQDQSQIDNMWGVREGLPEACSKDGKVYKYDISLPLPVLYKMVEEIKQHLSGLGLYNPNSDTSPISSIVAWGHIGDGNLHLNITAPVVTQEITSAIEPWVYEWSQKYDGSISAEHGLGLMKAPYLKYSKSVEVVELMRKLKAVLDPQGIMSPYKYLPKK